MPIKKFEIDSPLKRAALAAVVIICVVAAAIVLKWTLGNALTSRAADAEVADLAVSLAPGDPQTHYTSAVVRERSLEAADSAKSLLDFETAAAISPNNYLIWLAVGRAREFAGDRDGAEKALMRARELAPAYSRVRWALGNVMLRQGKTEDGFAEMRAAASVDVSFADPLVFAAHQFYADDAAAQRAAVGDSSAVLAALSKSLAGEKKFDAALETWRQIPNEESLKAADTGRAILGQMIAEKKFMAAMQIANLLQPTPKFSVAKVDDGGFENGIAASGASVFKWTLGSGTQPQIALTDGQKHAGAYSLLVIFRATPGKEFRSLSQTVAVERGTHLRLSAYYRSDIKTAAKLYWQALSACDAKVLAATPPVVNAAEWTELNADVPVPSDCDGVTLRLFREDCPLASCVVAGNLWIDDVALTRP